MGLTLQGFLDLPSVRDARPEEAVAPGAPDLAVRWVHSSEIYEIGPLLSCGDLLLTTGLGLAGVDAGARRHWVRELAARRVAGVAVELGRSLPDLPAEVRDEAARQGLPLYVLRQVVPFIRICEEANGAILHADAPRLRMVDRVLGEVHAALAAGGGTPEVVSCAAAATGGPAALVTRSGQLVAAAGVGGQRAAERLLRRPAASAPVRLWDVDWGAVLLGTGPGTDPAGLQLLAARLASVAAVAVGQSGAGSPGAVAAPLLSDLLADAVPGTRELLVRAGLAGFHPSPEARVLGIAASAPDPRQVLASWAHLAVSAGLELLADRVRGEALGLVAVPAAANRPDPAGWLAAALPEDNAVTTVGPVVPLAEAGHSLREAHDALPMATLLGRGSVVTRDLTLLRLLGRLDDRALTRIVEDALAPLTAWDAAYGSDLVRTLAVHLRYGGSRTRTAEALHVQRQSLYQRLARIEALLGRPVDDPTSHEHLVVATSAVSLLDARARQSAGVHRRR
ncbi:PucR family transcriptional regulator ligand-binding domain-containing protein [Blastococcus sp. BMG 814]|uniref:PucR family transcriptional regulator ligand-binding domain-containing protein n=1 Tax=Blastococcus carthaginiensis TaxID=3050034 RepID=A0ABT9IGR0_9ACTN|nr:PucR family transcriptional regulator [Blastococcus carthaginiensis]MDP5184773.1 PucR family transcriptional regulator ligand-binding domain-containing protein [Blastococcus carthaginiensis]